MRYEVDDCDQLHEALDGLCRAAGMTTFSAEMSGLGRNMVIQRGDVRIVTNVIVLAFFANMPFNAERRFYWIFKIQDFYSRSVVTCCDAACQDCLARTVLSS